MNSKPQMQLPYLLQLVIQNISTITATSPKCRCHILHSKRHLNDLFQKFSVILINASEEVRKAILFANFFSPHSSFVKSQIRWEKVLLKHS